jgi:hypothetical protein
MTNGCGGKMDAGAEGVQRTNKFSMTEFGVSFRLNA